MTDKTLQDRLRDPAHGFDRNDSHTEDRYVCLCEHLANEAADALDAQADKINRLSVRCESQRFKIEEQEARIKALEGALRSLVDLADAPATSVSVVSAAHDRIVNRARELFGEK